MRKLHYLLLSLLILSCSIDRKDEVIQGLDGRSTLVRTADELAGENCANGGLRIDFGLDQNFDQVLQDDEVETTSYVCNGLNGKDGKSSLVQVTTVDGNEDCPNGGVQVNSGLDLNGNGILDAPEVSYTTFVCNGLDGTDGQDGNNGFNSVIRTDTVEEGDICEEGGFIFSSGLDSNENGILDDSEITSQETVCNGEDGLSVLYNITTIEETDSCPTGGILIETGLDANENGTLDADEIANTNFVCNGLNGVDGTNGYNSLVSTEEIDGGVIIRTGLDINNNNILDSDEVMSTSTILNGEDGTDGTNGLNSLIRLDDIAISSDFPTGGVQISTGLDLNGNNILEDSEISNISYISNGVNGNDGADGQDGQDGTDGINGLNSVIRILEDTPNNTSTTVQVGIDDNNNGILDDDEVDSSTVIEDGVDGEDGNDGQDGNDGKCSFIQVLDEPAGDNCEFGGVKIITGKDDNGNLIFDEEEIDNIEYVCEYRVCVTTEVVEYTYDFEVFNPGDIVSSYGIAGIYGYRSNFDGNQFMIFDSNNPTGGDYDLNTNTGNIGIISEDNDSSDPDDNYFGGVMTFNFNKAVTFTSIDIIDVQGQHNYVTLIDIDGNEVVVEIPVGSNEQLQTMTFNMENVVSVVVSVCESAAVDNLKFKCTQIINNCN